MTHVEFREPTSKILRSSIRTVELGFKSALNNQRDLPVAAVALASDMILGEGVALDQSTGIDYLHAEVNAVQRAQRDWPIFEPTVVVTNAEPCADCQDFLASTKSIQEVMFLLSRDELVDMNLAQERPTIRDSKDLPYKVTHLNHPRLHHHALALFGAATREISGEKKGLVTFDRPKLLLAQRAFQTNF